MWSKAGGIWRSLEGGGFSRDSGASLPKRASSLKFLWVRKGAWLLALKVLPLSVLEGSRTYFYHWERFDAWVCRAFINCASFPAFLFLYAWLGPSIKLFRQALLEATARGEFARAASRGDLGDQPRHIQDQEGNQSVLFTRHACVLSPTEHPHPPRMRTTQMQKSRGWSRAMWVAGFLAAGLVRPAYQHVAGPSVVSVSGPWLLWGVALLRCVPVCGF